MQMCSILQMKKPGMTRLCGDRQYATSIVYMAQCGGFVRFKVDEQAVKADQQQDIGKDNACLNKRAKLGGKYAKGHQANKNLFRCNDAHNGNDDTDDGDPGY